MLETLAQPWPWYVAGPLVGLTVPLLLLVGGKMFGISSNMRHLCAALLPTRQEFFRYDWLGTGLWNLVFAAGIIAGGWLAATWLGGSHQVEIAPATASFVTEHGLSDLSGPVPAELFTWPALATLPGFLIVVGGAFLVGFGARYAGGCTSGHAISGLANLQVGSLLAVLGFFAGGLVSSRLILPILLRMLG